MMNSVSQMPHRRSSDRRGRTGSTLPAESADNSANVPLGEALVAAGLIRREDLEGSLTRQTSSRRRLGELLIEMGLIDEDRLLPFLGRRLGLPGTRLREGMVDPAVVREIPRNIAERLCVLAMFRVHRTLTVAMADPQNLLQIDELERLTGCRVNPVLALRTTIEKFLPRCYEEDYRVDDVTAGIEENAVEVQSDVVRVDLDTVADRSEALVRALSR